MSKNVPQMRSSPRRTDNTYLIFNFCSQIQFFHKIFKTKEKGCHSFESCWTYKVTLETAERA